MKKKRVAMIVKMALLFALALPSALMADSWDKATKLTFNEPVEVPGMVLPAGTYWVTLADDNPTGTSWKYGMPTVHNLSPGFLRFRTIV